MGFQFHQFGDLWRWQEEQGAEQGRGEEQQCLSGLEDRIFGAILTESEIGGLHPKGEDDVQKSSVCEEDRDFTISSGVVNAGEQRGEQVVDEPPDDAAEAVPEGLARQFADVSQSRMLLGCENKSKRGDCTPGHHAS